MSRDIKPADIAFPGISFDDCCLGYDEGTYGEIRDASKCARASAIWFFANEACVEFSEVRCRVRYARFFTRQEVWDKVGRDRWWDDAIFETARELARGDAQNIHLHFKEAERAVTAPAEPPADWRPDESMPAWEFCARGDSGAQKVYVCEVKA